jgi:hypothetical protein
LKEHWRNRVIELRRKASAGEVIDPAELVCALTAVEGLLS